MHPDQEVIIKEVEETIAIMMKMAKEEEEEEIEEVEDVEEETMEVKKGVKDKKAMKAEDNIEVEEEAEDIVTIEEETEVIVIIKKVIEEKREFIKINKLVNYLRTRNRLKSNNSKINKDNILRRKLKLKECSWEISEINLKFNMSSNQL